MEGTLARQVGAKTVLHWEHVWSTHRRELQQLYWPFFKLLLKSLVNFSNNREYVYLSFLETECSGGSERSLTLMRNTQKNLVCFIAVHGFALASRLLPAGYRPMNIYTEEGLPLNINQKLIYSITGLRSELCNQQQLLMRRSPPLALPANIPTMWTVSQLKPDPATAGGPPGAESHWMFIQRSFAWKELLVCWKAIGT